MSKECVTLDWIEVQVTATPAAVEAVAHILTEEGAAGVVEAGPAVRTAYLANQGDIEARIDRIRRSVADLARFGLDPGPADVRTRLVAEESWADSWKQYFFPTPIGARLVIRPTWCEYTPRAEDLVIDLDPGMAFGTGTHPTTRLCAEALERSVAVRSSVIDVGTGSGILAIAAALLGAARVTACDTDAVAVSVARANAAANGVDGRIDVLEGSWDRLLERGVRGDVVVANIIASVIESMIPDVHALLNPGGRMILSGIAAFRKPGVVACLRRHGYTIAAAHEDDQWVALEAVSLA